MKASIGALSLMVENFFSYLIVHSVQYIWSPNSLLIYGLAVFTPHFGFVLFCFNFKYFFMKFSLVVGFRVSLGNFLEVGQQSQNIQENIY